MLGPFRDSLVYPQDPYGVSTLSPSCPILPMSDGARKGAGFFLSDAILILASIFGGTVGIRIVIVDDQPVVRMGYQAFFANRSEFDVVAATASGEPARAALETHRPDLVVIDAATSDECRRRIQAMRQSWSKVCVVLCADLSSPEIAVQALEAGASAVVSRRGDMEDVAIAAQRALRGDNYLDPGLAGAVVAHMRADEERRRSRSAMALSVREEQVVRGLLRGHTNKEIAVSLRLSEKTVKHYVGNLKDKFNAKNRLEIAMTAREHFMA